jgi:hypothetical protein
MPRARNVSRLGAGERFPSVTISSFLPTGLRQFLLCSTSPSTDFF